MSTIVTTQRTFPATLAEWVATRYRAAVMALDRRDVPFDRARRMALAFLAHWWREIGPEQTRYRAEYNYNFGNIKCYGTPAAEGVYGWHGECHRLTDGQVYRSYRTVDDGVEDYVRLISGPRYLEAYQGLLENPDDGVGFYARLLHSGYSPFTPQAMREFASIAQHIDRVRGRMTAQATATTQGST